MNWVIVCFDSPTCVPCNHTMYECSKCRRHQSPCCSRILAVAGSCHATERFVHWMAWNWTKEDYFQSDSHTLSTNFIVCKSPMYYRWTMVSEATKLSLSIPSSQAGVALGLCRYVGRFLGYLSIHPLQTNIKRLLVYQKEWCCYYPS